MWTFLFRRKLHNYKKGVVMKNQSKDYIKWNLKECSKYLSCNTLQAFMDIRTSCRISAQKNTYGRLLVSGPACKEIINHNCHSNKKKIKKKAAPIENKPLFLYLWKTAVMGQIDATNIEQRDEQIQRGTSYQTRRCRSRNCNWSSAGIIIL